MTGFALHPQLAADTREIGQYGLCRILLMNDATYPWLVLVPERPDIREIHQLDAGDRGLLMDEIVRTTQALETLYTPTKLNVAALGNMVPQLHVHVIARFDSDAAWPGPVWGKVPATPYPPEEADALIGTLRSTLELS
ncbi:MAG: HIT family protein [Alphaproteobacteria bacterium]|nr:HIT family protein [Alphaproteobacteria bacterium]MBU0797889.1 HIT family protein [Alphaproteobacteria bacterium]MBU0886159.1 HIT family protein [Alphaproteobacteria bacterium]MBU1812799.1 HIT family protein [Alphaproteobacteria bacterium]MBU2091778.1 HIT family protein [Alphaproteobacteria bacterium]